MTIINPRKEIGQTRSNQRRLVLKPYTPPNELPRRLRYKINSGQDLTRLVADTFGNNVENRNCFYLVGWTKQTHGNDKDQTACSVQCNIDLHRAKSLFFRLWG